MTSSRTAVLNAGLVAVLLLSGCSKNAGISAEKTIVDDLQEGIGLGPLDAECGQPAAYEAGQKFTCTATADDGRVVEFAGEMTDEDTFSIYTTNLLIAEDVVEIRTAGAEVLGTELGVSIAPDDISCPDEIVLLDSTGDFICDITDAGSGEVYDLTISTGGIEPGEGIRELSFQIGDEPK